ncbi:MAG: hypothetical protein AMJ79_01615 [Phycisphaerae bacterium SM23_30]|nr:MAG: hypothetical protein AMJ79_01615 [Phycisphaerae bacterium SM23_30]
MTQRNYVVGIDCRNMLQDAVQKQLPLKITNQQQKKWHVFKSCFLDFQSNRLTVAMPIPDHQDPDAEPAQGQEIAVSFKKGYHKCLFTTRIISQTQFTLESGPSVPALLILSPPQIEKIQRRAFNRSLAPPGEPITVTFWSSSAQGPSSDHKWRGQLYDLSAGGMGLTLLQSELPHIAEGEQVEICFIPLPGQEPLQLQARFRHATELPETGRFMLGFQLLGLEMDEHGRNLLRRIGRIVNVYKRHSKNIHVPS